jgi:hypothetical protein
VLKAFACLGFCGGAGDVASWQREGGRVVKVVDEVCCGCSEAEWKGGGCPLESLVVAREAGN